jgi:outer membrane PBP1 activator LpoA protein
VATTYNDPHRAWGDAAVVASSFGPGARADDSAVASASRPASGTRVDAANTGRYFREDLLGMNVRRFWLRWMAASTAASALSALAQQPTSPPAAPGAAAGATPGAVPGAAGRQTFGTGNTRIALLLETGSAPFGRAAQAVLAGVRAAHARDGQGVLVELIPVSEGGDDLAAVIGELSRRFALAIGPLTRNGVNVLADAGTLPVTVVALNQPDADRRPPSNLVVFGLAIEGEVRQIARAAYDDLSQRIPDRRPLSAMVIGQSTPLARRASQAFGDAWRELGGALAEPVDTEGRSPAELRSELGAVRTDVVFASVGVDALRTLRGALPRDIPIYGTSQLNSVLPGALAGRTELDGVRLLDMPWQLLPEHPAVMAYPKAPTLGHADFQRLYALGIDAYRIARELVQKRTRIELDGVTGRLRLDLAADTRVDRTSVLAEFRNGTVVPVAAP